MRRILALAGAALVALTVAAAPAAQAAVTADDVGVRAANSVFVFGKMEITDDDSWPADDDHATVQFNQSRNLSASLPAAFVNVQGCADEVRGELKVELERLANDVVRVSVDVYLYEYTSTATPCGGADRDAETHEVFEVLPGSAPKKTYKIKNGGTFGGDVVEVKLTVSNMAS